MNRVIDVSLENVAASEPAEGASDKDIRWKMILPAKPREAD